MDGSTPDKDGAATVELVEISEQLEPLMPKAASLHRQGSHGNTSERIALASPQGATPVPASSPTDSEDGKVHSISHHRPELIAGGIPKNRKRPGSTSDSQRVTMKGTVTRGNSVGQPVEVQLELTETEFVRLTSRDPQVKEEKKKCECGRSQGPHIIIWSIFCIPVAMVVSLCISFYNGSMTWYNLIIYFSEEKSVLHRVTICPILILSFPVTVALSALILSFVASFMQVSWSWRSWWAEFCDGEKGFYGWFCSKVGLPKCSPYQVVVLDDSNN